MESGWVVLIFDGYSEKSFVYTIEYNVFKYKLSNKNIHEFIKLLNFYY
jgi:hypothetical protein